MTKSPRFNDLARPLCNLIDAHLVGGERVGRQIESGLVVRLPGPTNDLAIASHAPGASWVHFAQVVEVQMRVWESGATFRVAALGRLRGLDLFTRVAADIARAHGANLWLYDIDHNGLQVMLDDQMLEGIDRSARVAELIVSTRTVTRIELCGRCGGTGRERRNGLLTVNACGLCAGDGLGREMRAAE